MTDLDPMPADLPQQCIDAMIEQQNWRWTVSGMEPLATPGAMRRGLGDTGLVVAETGSDDRIANSTDPKWVAIRQLSAAQDGEALDLLGKLIAADEDGAS